MTKAAPKVVHVDVDGMDADGRPFHYSPGDTVADEHAAFVTNPAVFVEPGEPGAAHGDDHRLDLSVYDDVVGATAVLSIDDGDPDGDSDGPFAEIADDLDALKAEADARDVAYPANIKDPAKLHARLVDSLSD